MVSWSAPEAAVLRDGHGNAETVERTAIREWTVHRHNRGHDRAQDWFVALDADGERLLTTDLIDRDATRSVLCQWLETGELAAAFGCAEMRAD